MKLQKTTLGLLTVAVLLGAGVSFYEIVGKPHQQEVQEKQKQIYTFKEEDVQTLTVEKGGKTLKFERTKDNTQVWRMKQPEDTNASDAAVSFLLDLLVERPRDRTITVPMQQLKDYGLNPPLATITVQLANQETHKLVLGNPNLENLYIYGQIDPPENAKEVEVVLIPKEFQYAVERDLAEWKQPQEKETDQPSPQSSSQ
ncbi:DUF4340 domain-containing protein [Gloeothece verrucosa]|uniref:DUF4340 domain-containing protein n=1 Tax=Gloeothece verrucosa (strain PCC 7822) TaxID=497965 RepID=E0U9W2_GLOV7|nr:DUF4340 domain-containing protein [Gloeothece verrucosa]ADN15032.1 conserved hypothetical protein [Gloeothece verrucosa PCC 7822]